MNESNKINIILEENKSIKRENEENKEKIKLLLEENKEIKTKLNALIEENNIMKNLLNKYKNFLEEKSNEFIFKKQYDEINFNSDPQNLNFYEYLTNNHSNKALMSNFEVFIGLKDNLEYLVYNNKSNFNLEVMLIKDKKIKNSLVGHKNDTSVIKYIKKNKDEDYLLSCDKNKLIIIWDIQNNFNKKYNIQESYSGDINDAHILFNINDKDYILLSSGRIGEYSKLYEFKENTPYIKDIYNTNNNNTYLAIPWLYKGKYYIIELCDCEININNLFEEECYASLNVEPEGSHYSGYIYNDNYLCVSDYFNSSIRIWDLVNKIIYKEIKYTGSYGSDIIHWNNIYSIIACGGGFVVIDVLKEKMLKMILLDNKKHELGSLKKIKINGVGECLICSDRSNNIRLFKINA